MYCQVHLFVPVPYLGLLNLHAHIRCFYSAIMTSKLMCVECSLL